MSVLRTTVRRGAYHDSIVLMQLQAALVDLPGIEDAGVVMATAANLSMLASNGLLPEKPPEVDPGDLMIAVLASTTSSAEDALEQVEGLLARRNTHDADGHDYRPRSLRAAARMAPCSRWVLISVPGAHAAPVARQALELGKNVFLYSDNVSRADEAELKRLARRSGLVVLGPDCGTAILGGSGLGFANRVRPGEVGLVAASGTGLQAVASRVHALDGGISHALGTGGRDLSDEVGAITALAGLDLLERDPSTSVIVLISKPPSAEMAARVLARARRSSKPVVVAFLGYPSPARQLANLHFARDLDEAAELAVGLLSDTEAPPDPQPATTAPTGNRRFLRGLFSGGTLAYEALLGLHPFLRPMSSNLHLDSVAVLDDPHQSQGHCIVDLGEDALTVGRLHPMMDPDAARRRLLREAEDPETAVILLDVVLGDVAHLDPAAELGPTVQAITGQAGAAESSGPEVVVLLVGTDLDPQDVDRQAELFELAGARVERRLPVALERVLEILPQPEPATELSESTGPNLDDFSTPISVLNVGLEVFHTSLLDQGADSLQVDWRPPAGGNSRLMAILEKMKS